MKNFRRGFWKEFFSRDNSVVNTMAVIALVISAPIVVLSCAALIYDIFWLSHGLRDPSVKLLIALITASTGGLAVSQFSKRTVTEMMRPPGTRGPKPQGEQDAK
jgi:hypothetical protein